MRRLLVIVAGTLLPIALLVPTVAADHRREFTATLTGFHETPSVMTDGRGTFKAKIRDGSLWFELRYRDLTDTPLVAHIHFGQPDVAGGVMAFLCGGGGKPACPAGPATITGTVTPADVRAIAAQGIEGGDFGALEIALRRGVAYVNVHTPLFQPGEIRGNVRSR